MVNDDLSQIFFECSHHLNTDVYFVSQNIFHQNKNFRTMSLNSHYTILTKNPRDSSQIELLSRRISRKHSAYIVDAFHHATSLPYGYMVFDHTQKCPDLMRFRANIFPDQISVENPLVCYVEKSKNSPYFKK